MMAAPLLEGIFAAFSRGPHFTAPALRFTAHALR